MSDGKVESSVYGYRYHKSLHLHDSLLSLTRMKFKNHDSVLSLARMKFKTELCLQF